MTDEEKEDAGELVKNYISQVRSWKSEQGIALNAPLQSSGTFSADASSILKIKPSGSIIKYTLKYPEDHKFIVGKPDIEEKIIAIKPIYSKIGPLFKKESKKINKWIEENQDDLIKRIEKNGDIFWSDIPVVEAKMSNEGLVANGYVQIIKDFVIKGKEDSHIFHFDKFYVEFKVSKHEKN